LRCGWVGGRGDGAACGKVPPCDWLGVVGIGGDVRLREAGDVHPLACMGCQRVMRAAAAQRASSHTVAEQPYNMLLYLPKQASSRLSDGLACLVDCIPVYLCQARRGGAARVVCRQCGVCGHCGVLCEATHATRTPVCGGCEPGGSGKWRHSHSLLSHRTHSGQRAM
jgi:hypothetical protein